MRRSALARPCRPAGKKSVRRGAGEPARARCEWGIRAPAGADALTYLCRVFADPVFGSGPALADIGTGGLALVGEGWSPRRNVTASLGPDVLRNF
jgi:hypothetical protein